MHLYLSPHADDVVLSCGGTIATLTRQQQRVVIFTLMIADPPRQALETPLARHFLALWNLGENVIQVRRAEDQAAAAVLGAEIQFGDLLECGYRLDDNGQPYYATPESINAAINPHDPLRSMLTPDGVRALLARFALAAGDTIHAPLGVGQHVDHQIIRDVAVILKQTDPAINVVFYEEYPYAGWNDQVVPDAVAALPLPVQRIVHPLNLRARLLRIAAIASYRSQLKMIWPKGTLGMALRTWQFMAKTGGEAEWTG